MAGEAGERFSAGAGLICSEILIQSIQLVSFRETFLSYNINSVCFPSALIPVNTSGGIILLCGIKILQ